MGLASNPVAILSMIDLLQLFQYVVNFWELWFLLVPFSVYQYFPLP